MKEQAGKARQPGQAQPDCSDLNACLQACQICPEYLHACLPCHFFFPFLLCSNSFPSMPCLLACLQCLPFCLIA
jgi:hypothetical protein